MDISPVTDTVSDVEQPAEEAAGAEAETPAEEAVPAQEAAVVSKLGPGEELSDEELLGELAALLFACPEVLTLPRLAKLLRNPAAVRVKAALEALSERLASSGLPIVVRAISGGWRLMTDPAQGDAVARLRKEPKPEKISGAGLETLAIVAYRQPVTKAEIEAIRGVQSGQMLRSLVDRGLIKVAGRAETPGSPLQYATSKEFLDRFGLASLKDLPRDGELVQGS